MASVRIAKARTTKNTPRSSMADEMGPTKLEESDVKEEDLHCDAREYKCGGETIVNQVR